MLLVGTILEDDPEELLERVSTVTNVISVTQLLADEDNIHIELITKTQERAEDVVSELNELGIEISKTGVVTHETEQQFNHLGEEFTDE